MYNLTRTTYIKGKLLETNTNQCKYKKDLYQVLALLASNAVEKGFDGVELKINNNAEECSLLIKHDDQNYISYSVKEV